jgi:ATP-binding cassette subfamily F protein uup
VARERPSSDAEAAPLSELHRDEARGGRRGILGPMSAPVNLVNLERVSKAHGTTVLLDDVSLGVAAGERIGIVGRNGGGKTTLLEVLTGREDPDSGRVTRRSDLALGVLEQTVDLPRGATVRDVVLPRSLFAAEHEWAADPAVRSVLTGLELDRLGLDAPVDAMSGGERRRVALAAQLIRPLDLVVLDEPTNHLDVEGVAWLADYVKNRVGALLVVTHDRWFLDEVCTTTWEVSDGAVHSYEGGYAAYTLARAERARMAAATEERRQNLIRKELAWLRRGPPARTSKPRFRVEAAQALIADEPPPRDSLALAGFAAKRLGKTVYDVEDVDYTIRTDDGPRTLFHDLTWNVGPGDRIGIVGVNGAGKTTLLRLLTGELDPDRGRVVRGQTVAPAYLSQHVVELPGRLRVLEAVQEVGRIVRLAGQEISASSLAERFGFPASRQWTPVGDLSGGERRRLQLLRLLMAEPNVLLLDEPTNDLDIDTLTALEDLLDSFPGTVLVVSHDRYFVDRVCDSVVALMGDGTLAALPGGVEEYLARRAAGETQLSGTTPSGTAPGPVAQRSAGDARAARKEAARLERRLAKLTADEERLHAALAAAATDYTKAAELDTRLKAVLAEKDEVETDWLAAAELAEG